MTGRLNAAIVRIRDPRGEPVGAGFLATTNLVVTCAHVASRALSATDTSLPSNPLQLDFPFIQPEYILKAHVVFWNPDQIGSSDDIAVVQLDEPAPVGARQANLVYLTDLWEVRCKAFGFPKRHSGGIWADAILRDRQADGLIQVESQGTYRIEPGFSGTPVWADEFSGVVGIVATYDREHGITAAFVIPAHLLMEAIHKVYSFDIPSHSAADLTLRIDSLLSLFAGDKSPDPILFLGAGASQKSGVPLTDGLVARAAARAYCLVNNRTLDDPTVRRSDWLPWLYTLPWYAPSQPPEDQYSVALANLLGPADRYAFLLATGSVPANVVSPGYKHLLDLLALRRVNTVLTTNFDTVLPDLAVTVPNPRRIRIFRNPEDYPFVSTAPLQPQLIYLHGDVQFYAYHYFETASPTLTSALHQALVPLMRDHPLIIVGYSGREALIMQGLFQTISSLTHSYQHGIYWCVLHSEFPQRVHPFVHQLADTVGPNFHLVPIESFDRLMALVTNTSYRSHSYPLAQIQNDTASAQTYDMQTVTDRVLSDLDWDEAQARLLSYCRVMNIEAPHRITREWLTNLMQSLDLARLDGNQIRPTVAGCLLLGQDAAASRIAEGLQIVISGEESQVFTGNIWRQLRVVDLLEAEFNAPFRLKGPISENVTPYPPLALKEIIVNALAHRRYDIDPCCRIVAQIEPEYIRVTSPGGLDETVLSQLPPDTTAEHLLGEQPIKGYRNPVIADFLYSNGEMDKLGSGLVDVRRWVRQNGGAVEFRVDSDNTYFEVILYRRPEKPDAITGAASPLKPIGDFITNILEISTLPTLLWVAETGFRYVPELLSKLSETPPTFVLSDGHLYTFSELQDVANPLSAHIRTDTISCLSLDDFLARENGQRRLVELLNGALRNYVESRGLIFEWDRKRIYFMRTDEGPRSISYQARLRHATRLVVKPHVSKTINQILYWEHLAAIFQLKQFGADWGLQIVPTYVFTKDGYRHKLPSERIGPLATRRLSREYNMQVDNHLVFWASFLADGQESICLEEQFGSQICLKATPASVILHTLPLDSESEASFSDEEYDELELELNDSIEDEENVDTDAS